MSQEPSTESDGALEGSAPSLPEQEPLLDPVKEAARAQRHAEFARGSKIGRYALGGYRKARQRRVNPKGHAAQ